MEISETGLYVSHLMVSFPTSDDRASAITKCAQVIEKCRNNERDKNTGAPITQIFSAASFGHESDAIIMIMSVDSKSLIHIEQEIKNSGVYVVDSFLSVTETSEYNTSEAEEQARVDALDGSDDEKVKMMSDWRERMAIYRKHKLYPELPPTKMDYFCFYPMSKKREGENNWFTLPFEKRAAYMRAHGALGRQYSGKVIQLITGATGLSDWEWGVCLFSKSLDDIKNIVYEMRFDEASALYGQFGHFTLGRVCDLTELI